MHDFVTLVPDTGKIYNAIESTIAMTSRFTVEPKKDWEYRELYEQVKKAIYSLPAHFNSEVNIEGIKAEDLFSLNTVLATTIEESVRDTLNNMRSVWNVNNNFSDCTFIRQPQTFPDIVLVRNLGGGEYEPIMGIELKSWYLLSKEKEPTFRYKITPEACAPQDLLVVIPWTLDNATTGTPEIHEPYITSAKGASKHVDYYWKQERNSCKDTGIQRPNNVTPYPENSDKIHDIPNYENGGNYGRVARSGMMDNYIEKMLLKKISGKDIQCWIDFLKSNNSNSKTLVHRQSNTENGIEDNGHDDPLQFESQESENVEEETPDEPVAPWDA